MKGRGMRLQIVGSLFCFLFLAYLYYVLLAVIDRPCNAIKRDDEVVDLGYQLHKCHSVDAFLVTFRNIPYAAPPLASLRFQAPQPPLVNRSQVQDPPDVIPPQGYPAWLDTGETGNVTRPDLSPVDPRTSEDCLALDVLLPRSVWENRNVSRIPVIVWIPGGGFDYGYKDASGNGRGLVSRSLEEGREGVILVSINYRLGMFGWMHGDGVTPNAGLLDQRLALEWVQEYIHLFGGDKDSVTVLAESAGAGSVLTHITAYGGTRGPLPFIRAIVQSPYYPPEPAPEAASLGSVLAHSNYTTLQTLQQALTEDLQAINSLIIGNSRPVGNFIFGTSIDGSYIPDLPTRLLSTNRYHNNLALLVGHNADEGAPFVPASNITTDEDYETFILNTFLTLNEYPEQLRTITQDLYPPFLDGSLGYSTQKERANLTIADAKFVCNARALSAAPFTQASYAYEYTVPPAVHGYDLAYTFFDERRNPGGDFNETVAVILQRYILNFARTGDPNGIGVPAFPNAEGGDVVQNIGIDGIRPIPQASDGELVDARCRFWQEAPYLSRVAERGELK